jgi:hypothetical protein
MNLFSRCITTILNLHTYLGLIAWPFGKWTQAHADKNIENGNSIKSCIRGHENPVSLSGSDAVRLAAARIATSAREKKKE